MAAGAFLDHRNRPAHLAHGFEVAQQNHRVCQIRDVHRGLHIADQSMLGDGHEGRGALTVEVQQQLVHVQDQGVLFGHGRLVAIDAVDDHGLDVALVDAATNPVGELAGGQFSGIHLFDQQIAAVLQSLQIDTDVFHALEQQAQFLVENEQGGFFTPGHGGGCEDHGNEGFAGTGRTENQRAGAGFNPAAEQRVHFRDAAGQLLAQVAPAVFGGHQAWKHMHAVAHDGEVVKAATVFLAPVLHHPDTPPFGAVVGGQFLQADHAVGHAVHGFVEGLGGQVVEQQHGGVVTHEVMLDREDLPAVAQ